LSTTRLIQSNASRHLNHALHMAAVTQIRHRHSEGRAYYERKVAEGKGHREALGCLKRRISDALYACMVEDADGTDGCSSEAREGNRGTTLSPARPAHTPRHRLFGQATPGPAVRLGQRHARTGAKWRRHRRESPRRPGRSLEKRLDKQIGLVRSLPAHRGKLLFGAAICPETRLRSGVDCVWPGPYLYPGYADLSEARDRFCDLVDRARYRHSETRRLSRFRVTGLDEHAH